MLLPGPDQFMIVLIPGPCNFTTVRLCLRWNQETFSTVPGTL